jgi:hypothetical protein
MVSVHNEPKYAKGYKGYGACAAVSLTTNQLLVFLSVSKNKHLELATRFVCAPETVFTF